MLLRSSYYTFLPSVLTKYAEPEPLLETLEQIRDGGCSFLKYQQRKNKLSYVPGN